MTTTSKLWLGFGTLIALTLVSVLAMLARVSSVQADLREQVDIARPRLGTTRQLETHLLRYVLEVRNYAHEGEERARAEAEVSSGKVDEELANYRGFASTDRRRRLAGDFATRWDAVKAAGRSLMEARDENRQPTAEEVGKLRELRSDLERFLREEMLREALDAFNARKASTFQNLQAIGGFAVALLLVGVLIAIATSVAVARSVMRNERAIAEQGERLRTTLASIGDGVITTDAAGRITNLNPVAESLTGWTNADAVGQPLDAVFRIVNEETRRTVENPAARALREGVIVGLANHTVLIAKDGTERCIDDSAAPIRCKEGELVGSILVFRDITEQRKTAAEIDRNHSLLDTLIARAPIGICFLDRELRYVRINDRLAEINGIPATQHLGRTVAEMVPDLAATVDEVTARILATGEPVCNHEFSGQTAAEPGVTRYWDESWFPVRDAGGEIIGFGAVVEETTARKRTAEALRASEERLRLATDAAELGIWMWQPETDYVVWENDWPYEILGIPRGEKPITAARFAAELVHPEDRAPFEQAVETTLRTGTRFDFKGRLRRPDGEVRWVEFTGRQVPGNDGTPVTLIGTAQNITAREQAEASLRQNAQLFSTLIEQAPMGTYVVDSQFRLRQVNPEAMPIFVSVKPLIGRDFDEVLEIIWGPKVGRECADIFRHTLQTGERYVSPRFSAVRQDIGEEQAFEWETQRVTLPDGQHGVVCYFHEITERRRSEAVLQQAKDAAEAANQSKDRFLAVLSHELRTPLTPVLMVAGALEHDPDLRPDVREDIAMIKRNIELETKLIDDLLDLSRVTSGKLELKLESVDLNEAVRQVCGICRPQLNAAQVQLEVVLGEEVCTISADPARLQQVLWNLLKNAIKFTPANGTVRVTTTRRDDGQCEVRVQDSGLGIPPEVLPRIFNAFEQGDARITRQFGGLGLGLAISRALVELHGGTIRAESQGPGHGATFIVELPGASAPATPAEPAVAAGNVGSSRVDLQACKLEYSIVSPK